MVKATGEAVLSMTMPMVFGVAPVALFITWLRTGRAFSACAPAVIEVWNTYL